jgi:hypothetical protein
MYLKNRYILIAVFIATMIMIVAWSMPWLQANSDTETAYVTNSIDAQQDQTVYAMASNTLSEPAEKSDSSNHTQLEANPMTDSALIVSTVKELAGRQETALLGKPGWIYVRRIEVASDEQKQGEYGSPSGASIPFAELVPAQTPIFEGWSHVDETGLYHEALGLVLSPNGTIHQHSILYDGTWTHLTLRDNGFPQEQYRSSHSVIKVHLPASYTAQWLAEIVNLDNITLTAYQLGEQYTVVKESIYKEPFRLGSSEQPGLPAPAVGDKTTYIFDMQTGQLLSEEVYYILEDGRTFLAGNSEYHVAFMPELPPEKAPLYYDAVNTIMGEQ